MLMVCFSRLCVPQSLGHPEGMDGMGCCVTVIVGVTKCVPPGIDGNPMGTYIL